MKLSFLPLIAVASVCSPASVSAASYASSVIQYNAGVGAASGYQDSSTALGEPSRVTPAGAADAAITPFNPPWTPSQLVSIGKGGSLTLQVSSSIQNDPSHAYGVDFILFGNNGFQVTDYNVPPQNWTTDGSLFTFDPAGSSVVSVSENGTDFYRLVPPSGVSATVDGLFPTDAEGSFVFPVDPHLTAGSFAGKDLSGMRALYAGSAGGAGFDLAWAQTADGKSAGISIANYVRLDVLDGKVEVDALSVVPEPSSALLALLGVGVLSLRRSFRLRSRA